MNPLSRFEHMGSRLGMGISHCRCHCFVLAEIREDWKHCLSHFGAKLICTWTRELKVLDLKKNALNEEISSRV
jgi:hypothetical protein